MLCFFIAILFFRSSLLFTDPRLWAEEGSLYYNSMQFGSISQIFELVVRGNYQFLTNALVFISTIPKARYAAFVTTYSSLLILIINIIFLNKIFNDYKISIFCRFITVATIALLPQGYEIYLNATNVQWLLAVSILYVSIFKFNNSFNKYKESLLLIWISICGLTGLPSAILFPLFLFKGLILKQLLNLKIGLILLFSSLFHLIILLLHIHPDRNFLENLNYFFPSMVLQTMLSPLIGVSNVDFFLNEFSLNKSYILLVLLFFYLIFSAITVYGVYFKDNLKIIIYLLIFWFYTTFVYVLGSLGNPEALFSGAGGGRYFYFGANAFLLCLVMETTSKAVIYRYGANLILSICLCTGIFEMQFGNWKTWLVQGSSWSSQVNNCGTLRPCIISAWPGGSGWSFILNKD